MSGFIRTMTYVFSGAVLALLPLFTWAMYVATVEHDVRPLVAVSWCALPWQLVNIYLQWRVRGLR